MSYLHTNAGTNNKYIVNVNSLMNCSYWEKKGKHMETRIEQNKELVMKTYWMDRKQKQKERETFTFYLQLYILYPQIIYYPRKYLQWDFWSYKDNFTHVYGKQEI